MSEPYDSRPWHFAEQAVPFHRLEPRIPDGTLYLQAGHSLLRLGPRHVPDLLLDHRSVEIVRAEVKGGLGEFDREHYPIGLDVRYVVEHQPAHGNRFQVVDPCGRRKMAKKGIRRLERKRDKADETARPI